MRDRKDLLDYYESFGMREWQRLETPSVGAIEFAVTCFALEKHLPSKGRVLDIGGGPGRYAIWLAKRGYQVVLADLSPEMLSLARLKVSEAGVSDAIEAIIEVEACDLSSWSEGSFDAVLSLGPFYHLFEDADRKKAAEELVRVLRPNGVAFIMTMPRYAFLRRTVLLSDERHHILQADWILQLMEEGIFQNDVPGRFTHGFGFSVEEIAPFFESFGLSTDVLLAAEGFSAGLESSISELTLENPSLYEEILRIIIENASDPSILGMSLHVLYVGVKSGVFKSDA